VPELWGYELATKTSKKLSERANRFHVVAGSTKIVYSAPDALHVLDVLSGVDHRVADFTGFAYAGPGASKVLFYSAPQTIQLLDAISEEVTMLATDASEELGNAEVSANQAKAIFAREEITGRALYYVDIASKTTMRIFAYTEEARLSRDGNSVLLWTFRGPANLFLWTGGEATLIDRFFVPSGGPRYDEQMKYIAFFTKPDATDRFELRFYDVAEEDNLLLDDEADPSNMRIATDGSRVVFYEGTDPTYGPLNLWERATKMTSVLAPRATRELITKSDLSAIAFSEPPTAERISLWTVRDSSPAVIAEHGSLGQVAFDPTERRLVFASDGDLWLDVLEDTTPPALFARDAAEAPVLTESLIAYAVRAGTSTASGVYIAPLP
jgi:hypothetical protein